jgi:hypothetical protein
MPTSEVNARTEIISAARQYFKMNNPPKDFIPGQTYIPVTAKVVDDEDLDFWSMPLWTCGSPRGDMHVNLNPLLGNSSADRQSLFL